MERLINITLVLILVCVGYGMAQYKGPIVTTEAEIVTMPDGSLYACPTASELEDHTWVCSTDADCNSEYLEAFNADPHVCGDEA